MQIIREDHAFNELVRARNSLENRGFSPYPCKVEEWLQQHDPELSVWHCARTDEFRVVGAGLWTIMSFQRHQLNNGIVEHIKRIDSQRGYRAIDELNKHEEKQQRDFEKKQADAAYNLAKDTRKYVSQLH